MSRTNPLNTLPVDRKGILSFRKLVLSQYKKLSRPMPWRENCSSYYIFISEVMLQQTQVDRVMKKFPPFIARFPGFRELAESSLSDVYDQWQGLGYNRRAKWLRDAAIAVMENFGGTLPADPEQIATLPGIGKNTAGAIAAYAFNLPAVYIETNVRTVFIHHFFRNRKDVKDEEILTLAEEALDRRNPRVWYWALMDYGTVLKKTERNPSRKSAHHRKQAAFKGSDRSIRGAILRQIASKGSVLKKDIDAEFPADPVRLEKILNSLTRDGMIREEAGTYRLGE
jgi:A/G-specific adenine glycosylase